MNCRFCSLVSSHYILFRSVYCIYFKYLFVFFFSTNKTMSKILIISFFFFVATLSHSNLCFSVSNISFFSPFSFFLYVLTSYYIRYTFFSLPTNFCNCSVLLKNLFLCSLSFALRPLFSYLQF